MIEELELFCGLALLFFVVALKPRLDARGVIHGMLLGFLMLQGIVVLTVDAGYAFFVACILLVAAVHLLERAARMRLERTRRF